MSSASWERRLAVLGAVSAGLVALKAFRLMWLCADLCLGPVRVRRFKGEWALITGGSEGVGKAVAMHLAKVGLNVVLVSRSQPKLDAAARGIRQTCPAAQVRTIAADLSSRSGCQEVLQQLEASNTAISVLVASVGAALPKEGIKLYWELTDEEEQQLQDINGASYLFFIKHLLPGMVQRARGAVVAVSSVAAFHGAFMAQYGAEKAKLNALMTSLDTELSGTGVTAQAMVLGGVITPAASARYMEIMAPADTRLAASASAAAGSDPVAAAEARMERMRRDVPAARLGLVGTADAVGAAIVRRIGWGAPVQVPYWGHALLDPRGAAWALLWPPELHRAAVRFAYGRIKVMAAAKMRAATAATASGAS